MLGLLTCQRATLLLEQRADAPLDLPRRLQLWVHLRYCPLCSRYAVQTAVLNRLAQHRARTYATLPGLPAEARERLQRVVEQGMQP